MSLQQMVEEIKVLTGEEMEALQNELDRERLMRSSHESAKRWAGKTFDVRMSANDSGLPDLFAEDFRIKS